MCDRHSQDQFENGFNGSVLFVNYVMHMFCHLQIIHPCIFYLYGAQLFCQQDPSLLQLLQHEHYNKVVLPTVMGRIKSSIMVFKNRNDLFDCVTVK